MLYIGLYIGHHLSLYSDRAYQQYSPWRRQPPAALQKVPAPHYGHPLTISRYTEGDDLACTSPHKVLHDQTTSEVSNSIQISDFHAIHYRKTRSLPPPPEHTIQIVYSLDKLNANLMMANVEAKTCSW